jgi:quinol monooxygenase YgiN
MVQLFVRLVASPARVVDVVEAFRAVMRPAQQARGCSFAGVYVSANDSGRVVYVEDWDDEGELRGHFGTERFHRLLELLEMAADPPVVEFRVISETHGLEYISSQQPNMEIPRGWGPNRNALARRPEGGGRGR